MRSVSRRFMDMEQFKIDMEMWRLDLIKFKRILLKCGVLDSNYYGEIERVCVFIDLLEINVKIIRNSRI